MKIDERIIEEYEKKGAVCLRNVFSDEWLEIVANGIQKNLESPGPLSEKLKGDSSDACYFDDLCSWQRIPEIKKFVLESPAATIAGQFMKSEYAAFYHDQVLVKEPGTDKKTPWHHDQPYYPVDGNKPGDCIVFHMRTIHGAPGNSSRSHHRRALATRWLGDDAVIVKRPWETSPPTLGGLGYGDKAVGKEFPIVWRRDA